MVSFGVCITAGIALAFWACYAFSFVMPSSASWRLPLAIPILFIVVALVLMLFLPESPRYLILNGREKEALNVLSALNEMPPDHEDIRREYLMIKNAIIYMIQGASMPAIFSMGKSRYAHRVLLAIALQVMQQVSWTTSGFSTTLLSTFPVLAHADLLLVVHRRQHLHTVPGYDVQLVPSVRMAHC